jgi:hypothetical protein
MLLLLAVSLLGGLLGFEVDPMDTLLPYADLIQSCERPGDLQLRYAQSLHAACRLPVKMGRSFLWIRQLDSSPPQFHRPCADVK